MKNFLMFLSGIAMFLFAIGCQSTQKKEENANQEELDSTQTISVSPVVNSPGFPDAILEQSFPIENAKLDTGKVAFNYEIKNYQLTAQTLDAELKQCANSAQGQHIHHILNNQPYTALYEPKHEANLPEGNYIVLSFLSRSYHESLKHSSAYVLRQFTVGDVNPEPTDLNAPHMFYSRPKGEYKGKDTEHVMLDFYLVNTSLAENGNKVRATINGSEFLIDTWQPYMMEGLPMGTNTVKLELIDKDGNLVSGPFNSVERTFTLSAE